MNFQEILAELLDHIRGMWRFRWHAVGVAWIVAILGWAAVYSLPNVYEASARVSVNSNSLLPKLTKGLTAGENLLNEVSLVYRALLSRPNLGEVIRRTGLDEGIKSPRELENLISRLQRKIEIESGQGGSGKLYQISYEAENREMAVSVVQALLDTFVESSLVAQVDDSEMTEVALASEIENHVERLRLAESALAEFKKRNLGYMPSNDSDYYSRLQAAMADVEGTDKQIRLLRLRRDEIVRQLSGELPLLSTNPSSPAQAIAGCSKAGSIAELQGELSVLQVDFTDKHPRIVILRDTIKALESACENELLAFGGNVPTIDSATGLSQSNPIYQKLRLQLSDADVELISLREERASSQRLISRLKADVDKIAEVEVSLKRLNRDYSVIETRHQELIRRWESLQSKKRLDPVTDPVQFHVWEPPFASGTPVSPDRPVLLGAVLFMSIVAGIAFSFVLNQLKPVYFRRHAVSRQFGVPVLGSVGLIASSDEISARRRDNFAWICTNFSLIAIGIVVVVLGESIVLTISALIGSMGL